MYLNLWITYEKLNELPVSNKFEMSNEFNKSNNFLEMNVFRFIK